MDGTLSVLAEQATRPRLAAPDFAAVKARWLADFENESGIHRNLRILLFGRAGAYGFARPSPEHTEGLRIGDVAALHAQLFQPAQATLVVVGDATPEAVDASAARWLGRWAPQAVPLPRAPAPRAPAEEAHVALLNRTDLAHTTVLVLARAPAPTEPDIAAVEVLTRALGGLSSPLHRSVREERSAAYAFSAWVELQRTASYAAIGGRLERDKAVPALRAIVAAVRAARTTDLGEAELERARASLIAEWRTRTSTNQGLASLAGAALAHGQPLDTIASYPARIQAVTAADARRAAERYFGDEALRVLAWGDAFWPSDLAALGLGSVELRDHWGNREKR